MPFMATMVIMMTVVSVGCAPRMIIVFVWIVVLVVSQLSFSHPFLYPWRVYINRSRRGKSLSCTAWFEPEKQKEVMALSHDLREN